jgi:hypothetical protein
VDVIVISQLGKVSGDGDSFLVMVAGAKPGLRVVEGKTPRLIEVECDEGVCPHLYPMKFSHVFRVGGNQARTGKLSTVSPTMTRI